MTSLDATLSAIADPTRRSILDRLAQGPASVGELAAPFGISQQAVSKHLASLERARLVEKRRVGRRHICALSPEPFEEVAGWLEGYRRLWERKLDRFEKFLRELQEKENRNAKQD